ncbi:MAG: hypothetical protein IBX55_01480 [Methyloprofundus sp.]|nr:hypothetical protein [Methyloprofundus sp.]
MVTKIPFTDMDIWVLVPLIPALVLWSKTTLIVGVLGSAFFMITSYFGFTIPVALRHLRRIIAGPLKSRPNKSLPRYRMSKREKGGLI